jgi:hypothetical protein
MEHLQIIVDVVVGAPDGRPPIGPHTAAQAEALPGSIRWGCHVATGWASAHPSITR